MKRFIIALAIMILAIVLLVGPAFVVAEDAHLASGTTPESVVVAGGADEKNEFEWIDLIVIPILFLLATTAVAVARIRNLWAAVMFTGIYSFLGASWMLILDAPDVAFTEAAVGAGIATVLMLATLALTGREEKPTTKSPFPALLVVSITGGALVYGTLDMPHFGSHMAPAPGLPNAFVC